jgi:hypothetical protein
LSTNGKRQQKKELKMPNHVTNQIIVNFNNEEEYDKFKELVVGDELQQEFDFDKIVPQPDDYCGYVHNQQYVNG